MTLFKGFLEEALPKTLVEALASPTLRTMFLEKSLLIELLEALAKPIRLRVPVDALVEPPLSEKVLAAVAQRLDNKNSKVRKAATNALGTHSILSGQIVERLAKRLDDTSRKVREAATRTLGAQSTLPGEILEAVAKRLDDKDSNVREATVYALGGQYNLPGDILKAVTKRLDDTESNVRQAVANILGFQPNFIRVLMLSYWSRYMGEELDGEFFGLLPYNFFGSTMADLDDEDSQVKETVRSAWTYQSTLSVEILTAMAERLNHEDRQTRKAITHALIGQSNLPGEIVETVAALLKDGNIKVRDAAARVLEKQSVLPEEIGQALAVVMEDQKIREETIYTDTSSHTEDETSLSPAIEDEISLSPAIEDEVSLSSDTDDEIAESLINEEVFSREKIEQVDAAFREGHWTYLRKLGKRKLRSGLQYESWLNHSFRAQLVWYIEDGNLCLQYAEELRKLTFKSREKQDQFMATLENVRADLGVPQ